MAPPRSRQSHYRTCCRAAQRKNKGMTLLFVLVVFTSSFLLAAVAVVVASHILDRKQGEAGSALEGIGFGGAPGILKVDEVSSITLWSNLLKQFDFVERMRTSLAYADISWSA